MLAQLGYGSKVIISRVCFQGVPLALYETTSLAQLYVNLSQHETNNTKGENMRQ